MVFDPTDNNKHYGFQCCSAWKCCRIESSPIYFLPALCLLNGPHNRMALLRRTSKNQKESDSRGPHKVEAVCFFSESFLKVYNRLQEQNLELKLVKGPFILCSYKRLLYRFFHACRSSVHTARAMLCKVMTKQSNLHHWDST